MLCREENIYSEEYYDLIIDYNLIENYIFPDCIQTVDARFKIGYYSRKELPPLSVTDYGYESIPKCFILTDYSAVEVTNILFLQNQPILDLKGQGVMVGFVDTGIDYANPIFRNEDGSTRIHAIWDQTIPGDQSAGEPIKDDEASQGNSSLQGFLYGTEYSAEDIDRALKAEDPYSVVPSRDMDGHGTFLAGAACGGGNPANNFAGAAPLAKIAVVKCKEAKKNLKDYYFIPESASCYSEADIMAGVSWLNAQAERLQVPLVICIGMGSGLGSHMGDDPISLCLNNLGLRRGRGITVSTGNQANARHHFQSEGLEVGQQENVEISVGENLSGFVLELWATVPNLYQVSVLSPTGELFQPEGGPGTGKAEHFFLFENTVVTIEYDIVLGASANQLAFFRFETPLQGIWTIRVKAVQTIQGGYHMWLQERELLTGEVFFLKSVPEHTATSPAYAASAITAGAFLAKGNSLYPNSGRGFSVSGEVKPDLAAPGVNVYGPGLRNDFITKTGTSIAAAITAGACAQLFEWGIVKKQYSSLNSVELQTILSRGARRSTDRTYPNPEWGYGSLDVFEALNQLRNQQR